MDVHAAWLHPDRGTGTVGGLRQVAAGHHDLHPHLRQFPGAHGRLPLRVGSGPAPVDDLSDACARRAGGAGQAGFCCDVDELPASVLREQPVSGGGPERSQRLGRRLLGPVRPRPRAGVEQPEEHRRVSPPARPADHPGVDEMTTAPGVSLIDVASYLPGEPIGADYYAKFADSDELRDNVMFRSPSFRHHVGPDESATDMVERAAQGLIERHGRDAIENVDILITHAQMPDVPFYGGGGAIAHRLGMKPSWVLDLHNGGCAAFVLGLKVARNLIESGEGRTALIAIAQNAAGQIFDQPGVRRKAQASVPGDGAAVGLVTLSDESPILDIECRTYGEFAGDMTLSIDPYRKWWQPGPGEGSIGFTETKIAKVLARGNQQVPEVALAVCDRIGLSSKDIDLLVTNQPNRVFLGNWREALEVPRERHRDTFDECGNLFGAGIPINLNHAISDSQVKAGDVVMMAAFAHAGDFAGAAAVRWGGRS